MVARPPPLGCMKNSPGLPIRVSLNQGAGVTMATHMTLLSLDTLQRKCCVYETQNHSSRKIFRCRSGQPRLYILYIQMHTHNHQQSWTVKNRWIITFSVQAFHTDGARPDLYCVQLWEQLAPSGAIPSGRIAKTALTTSEHTVLYVQCQED